MVKLVDTLASGASGGNPVEVQVLSWAPKFESLDRKIGAFLVFGVVERRGLPASAFYGRCAPQGTVVRVVLELSLGY